MAEKWREVPGSRGIFIRPTKDGQVEGVVRERVREHHEAVQEMRKHTKGRDILKTEGPGGLRCIGSMTTTQWMESQEKYGGDTAAYMRDHPQTLGVAPNSAELPKKKVYVSRHHGTRRNRGE